MSLQVIQMTLRKTKARTGKTWMDPSDVTCPLLPWLLFNPGLGFPRCTT